LFLQRLGTELRDRGIAGVITNSNFQKEKKKKKKTKHTTTKAPHNNGSACDSNSALTAWSV
jgi:hypothetical protein